MSGRRTSTRDAVLEYVRATYAATGVSPTVREIADALGLATTSTVHHHLTVLERHGPLVNRGRRGYIPTPEPRP